MKRLHLDLVRVTEAAAIAASEWVGRGDKLAADKAATDAMRKRLNEIPFRAEVAVCEGRKDASYMLAEGEMVGDGDDPKERFELAIDPIDGTMQTARSGHGSVSVIAMANRDCFFKTDQFYMQKLAVGNKKSEVDIDYPVEKNLEILSEETGKSVRHLTVCVLDRPRHEELVGRLRKYGCRIKLISDCDVSACIATCMPGSGVDMYLGVGGAPEAMITAAALKCAGGKFQCKSESRVLGMEELAAGDVMFCATGITDGEFLKGVEWSSRGPKTYSLSMRSESNTIRHIVADHGN